MLILHAKDSLWLHISTSMHQIWCALHRSMNKVLTGTTWVTEIWFHLKAITYCTGNQVQKYFLLYQSQSCHHATSQLWLQWKMKWHTKNKHNSRQKPKNSPCGRRKISVTWRKWSHNKDAAIATPSHRRSGCLRASTCKWDENQALFTATEWPHLYVVFHSDPCCSQQPIRKYLPSWSYKYPLSQSLNTALGLTKKWGFLTLPLTWTDIRHEPHMERKYSLLQES